MQASDGGDPSCPLRISRESLQLTQPKPFPLAKSFMTSLETRTQTDRLLDFDLVKKGFAVCRLLAFIS
jgi:hypothetical protein